MRHILVGNSKICKCIFWRFCMWSPSYTSFHKTAPEKSPQEWILVSHFTLLWLTLYSLSFSLCITFSKILFVSKNTNSFGLPFIYIRQSHLQIVNETCPIHAKTLFGKVLGQHAYKVALCDMFGCKLIHLEKFTLPILFVSAREKGKVTLFF